MDKASYEIRIRGWIDIIQAANASSLSKREWCAQNNVNRRQFYYWQKKVRDYLIANGAGDVFSEATTLPAVSKAAEIPVFCEIKEPNCELAPGVTDFHTEAVLKCGSLNVLISNQTSEALLARLVSVMCHD